MRRTIFTLCVLGWVAVGAAWLLFGDEAPRETVAAAAPTPAPLRGATRAGAPTPDAPPPVRARPVSPPTRSPEARAERDAVRARIQGALARSDADGAARPSDDEPAGNLSKEYIRDTIREDLVPLVRECYDDLLQRDDAAEGRVVMQFDIVGDESVGGIVDDVVLTDATDLHEDDFSECVRESMASVIFDPPEGGGIVQVTYPFIFEAA
jgi:hypothetical protein